MPMLCHKVMVSTHLWWTRNSKAKAQQLSTDIDIRILWNTHISSQYNADRISKIILIYIIWMRRLWFKFTNFERVLFFLSWVITLLNYTIFERQSSSTLLICVGACVKSSLAPSRDRVSELTPSVFWFCHLLFHVYITKHHIFFWLLIIYRT